MKRYIIKNCPCCWYINRKFPDHADCGKTYKRTGFMGDTEYCEYCKDIPDCLLKQIVEKCKKNKFVGYGAIEVENPLYSEIMQKLEIEEVDE